MAKYLVEKDTEALWIADKANYGFPHVALVGTELRYAKTADKVVAE